MATPLVRPQGVFANPPQARVGAFGRPGGLMAYIDTDATGYTRYYINAIVLSGPDNQAQAIRKARDAHRYMIASAAALANHRGWPTFKFYGWQANTNFQAHANKLAARVGAMGSGVAIGLDYEVILHTSKVLAENYPLG
ncbi:hypothetical protein [Reyranella sp. CPCC 100927]|uniref:hypothetical protein n=1 Tax=Reyranella sp. CPCC 100927 TaxID=2599616 RepID=UPI0011B7C766|nr:hypothetical protein [Reyranella sp. CPCC 100927]TWT00270.1 hypothetical protein FQU96_33635 [Reyranella sp. CPCC 100927]